MKREFFKFLKMHNLTKMFSKNLKKYNRIFASTTVYLIGDPRTFINGAFVWSQTEQGHDFWSKFDTLWMDYIKDDIKKLE